MMITASTSEQLP